ncbi:MAG: hypothetical protein ABII80_02070 [bacterium]
MNKSRYRNTIGYGGGVGENTYRLTNLPRGDKLAATIKLITVQLERTLKIEREDEKSIPTAESPFDRVHV